MANGIEDKRVEVAGVRTSFLERSGHVPIVFLHGNPGAKEDWLFMLERLEGPQRGLAFDLPGFGAADRPRGFDHTLAGHAAHFEAALKELGCDRVHLVVHDLGGLVGLSWAGRFPERLASLVLVDSGVLLGWRWHVLARVWQTPVVSWLATKSLTRWSFDTLVGWGNPRPLPRAFLDRLYATVDAGNLRAVRALYRSMRNAERLWATLAAGAARIEAPIQVIWGAADPYLPFRYAERQREIFPRAQVRVDVLEGCGHWPFVDEPERVATTIESFWATCCGMPRE